MSSSHPTSEDSTSWRGRPLPWYAPLNWLILGLRDLLRCPAPGLAHGALAALAGAVIVAIARDQFWLLSGAFSGFLLVSPWLACALYLVSLRAEEGRGTTLWQALAVWRSRDPRLVRFGLLLGLSGTGWVLTSAALITWLSPQPILRPMDFVLHVILGQDETLFALWMGLGALMAAPMFASSVVAMPLMLDQPRVTLRSAVLQSWEAVVDHPLICSAWACLLALFTAVGMASAMLGLVLILPWLSHASWHAYRDLRPGALHRPELGVGTRSWR